MANQIFISYRRDDSAYAAGRLYDRLSQRFGETNVFMDIDAIELGVNFREKIESAVGHCDVLLAVIGKQWLSMKNERGQRRLDDPNDYVRLEILAALKRNIHVIPVLVDGAFMPASAELPGELAALSEYNGLEIRHTQFNDDANRLTKGLESILSKVQAAARPGIPPVPPKTGGEKPVKVQGQSASPNRLASMFRYALLGVVSGLILAALASLVSGYSDSGWWSVGLSTNVIGGAIVGLIAPPKRGAILTGMLVGFILVLGVYLLTGEPFGDTIGAALVLGCAPGGVLGAAVNKARSGSSAAR